MEKSVSFGVAPMLWGVRVLLVEDDILLLMELEAIVLEAGADIAGRCRTVGEALAVVKSDDVDVAILDVRVGPDTIAPVAQRLATRGTPFIFYTGQFENDPQLAEWQGYRVLSKPAGAGTIVAAVAEILRSAAGTHHATGS